jgi:hypothetical protein
MGIAAGLGKLSGVNMDEGKIMTIYFILCLTAFGLISGLWYLLPLSLKQNLRVQYLIMS